jgi:hypothetical protein
MSVSQKTRTVNCTVLVAIVTGGTVMHLLNDIWDQDELYHSTLTSAMTRLPCM